MRSPAAKKKNKPEALNKALNKQKKQLKVLILVSLLALFGLFFTVHADFNEIIVNTNSDDALAVGATVCDTDVSDEVVTCSFRAAIEFANATANLGTADQIKFTGISGDDTVITVATDLPAITQEVIIDGTDGDSDVRDITIEGGQSTNEGILFDGPNAHGSVLKNLVVRGFNTFNLKIDSSVRTASTTYTIQDNYFGVDQDGDSVYGTQDDYNVSFENSDHINFTGNTAAGYHWYHIYANNTDDLTIQNSNIGANSTGAKITGHITSGSAVHVRQGSNDLTVHNNIIGGIEGGYGIYVKDSDDYTLTNNRVCIDSSNNNLCKDARGITVEGTSGNYSSGGVITGNVIDGADASDKTNGLLYGVELRYVDTLNEYSNNQVGSTNGFSELGSALLVLDNVNNSVFKKGASGSFGTAATGISFSAGDVYGNTFEDFSMTWVAGTPSGNTSKDGGFKWSAATAYSNSFSNITISGFDRAVYWNGESYSNTFSDITISDVDTGFLWTSTAYRNTFSDITISGVDTGFEWASGGSEAYENTFSNVTISNVNYGMDGLDGVAEEFNYFDGVLIHSVATNTFSQDPFTNANNGMTVNTPTVNSTSFTSLPVVNLSATATVTGASCTFSAYISGTDGETQAYLTSDLEGTTRQVAGTVNAGTCSLTNQDFIVPATYTQQATNYISVIATDIIASATLNDGEVVTNVKQSSTHSATATATFPTTAAFTVDDGDADHTETMFPKDTTITLDASTSTNAQTYTWDLNQSVDAPDDGDLATTWDDDGNPANDIDATGSSVTVNYITNKVNGSTHSYDLTGSLNFNASVTATGPSASDTEIKNLKLMDPSISGGVGTCNEVGVGNSYTASLLDMSSLSPLSLYWDFDTLTDAADDSDPATTWDNDGVLDNDQQSTNPNVFPSPVYEIGSYILALKHFDTAGQTGQVSIATRNIEVLAAVEAPTASFTHSVSDLTATFTGSATGGCITSWEWDFDNNGVVDSTSQSPSHTYSAAGSYSATLKATNSSGNHTTAPVTVNVTDVAPVADYTPSSTSLVVGSQVSFTNSSTGDYISAYAWDFDGDTVVDSTDQNPADFTYSQVGIFNAALTVTNPAGSHTKTTAINVNPSATFTISPTSGNTNTDFAFSPIVAADEVNYKYSWDFNGSIDETSASPTHKFTSSGVKSVKLTVTSIATPALTSNTTQNITVASSGGGGGGGGSYSPPSTSNTPSTPSTPSTTESTESQSTEGTAEQQSTETESTETESTEQQELNPFAPPEAQDDTESEAEPEAAQEEQIAQVVAPVVETQITDFQEQSQVVVELSPEVAETITEPQTEPETEPETEQETEAKQAQAETQPETQITPTEQETKAQQAQEETQVAQEGAEQTQGLQQAIEGLAQNLLGALFTQTDQVAKQEQAPVKVVLNTEPKAVTDAQVNQELQEVVAQKPRQKFSNSLKAQQVARQESLPSNTRELLANMEFDKQKQAEQIQTTIQKTLATAKIAAASSTAKTQAQVDSDQVASPQVSSRSLSLQDSNNNGISDAYEQVLGLNAQQAKQQAQTDPNLMAPRALIKNPAQAQKPIKLEFADAETFSQEHFIVNGLLDQELLDSTILADLETAKDVGEAQVEFYLVTGEDNLLIGTATLDENNNFSFINGSNLEAGTHNIVASYTDEKTKQKHFSAVTELTIDPTAPELDLNLESFAGLSASTLESTSLGSQASRQLAYAESSNGVKVLSGVELDPGQAINLSLDVDSNLARVVVNFQSVLYSATAITSSTNSEIDVQAPLELSFEPGSQHVATAYAESLEDPDLKSKPVIIEFSIKQTTPWYLQTYSLIAGLLLVVALGFGIFRRKKV